jgi:hypothetical protein
MNWLRKTLFPLLLIAIVYWPVSFLTNSLKWDNLDVILPFRYFASQCFENGILPLWNPYSALGYPVYADLQSPSFFPEGWITALFGGYSNYTLHFWFIVYLAIGFAGFRKWLIARGSTPQISTGYALIYALSGFFVGHGQVLFATVSGAFIPWILYFFNAYRDSKKSDYLIGLFFFAFLLITGGYPTLTLQLGYFMLFMGVFQWIFSTNKPSAKTMLSVGFTAAITLIATAFIWDGLYDGIQVVHRLSGLEDKYIFQNPFTWPSHLSFIYPSATIHGDFWGTDISMRNAYIGVIPLLILLLGGRQIWHKRKGEIFVAVVFWFFALGDQTPIHPFLAKVFPGLDLFRFPAYYMYWVSLLLLAWASEIHSVKKEVNTNRWIFLLLIFVGITGMTYGSFHAEWSLNTNNWYAFSESLNTPELLFISGSMYLLSGLLLLLLQRRQMPFNVLMAVGVLHAAFFVQTNMERTVVNPRSPKAIHALFDEIPEGFPAPEMRPLSENKDPKMSHSPAIWRNTAIFRKQPSEDAFSSFWLATFDQWQTDSLLRKEVLSKPVVYTKSGAGVTIQEFSPIQMKFASQANREDTLYLTQSYFPYWKATVDGADVSIYRDHINFMKIPLPEGDTRIQLSFHRPRIGLFFYFGTGLWLIAGVLLLFRIKYPPYRGTSSP